MESKSVTLFCELCRLCLRNSAVHNIFDGGNDSLSQDIFTFTGVTISCHDNLPQKICKICLDVIDRVRDLKRLALVNQNNLRLLFEDDFKCVKIEKADDIPIEEISNEIVKTEKLCVTDEEIMPVHNNANEIRIRKDLFVTLTPPTLSESELNVNTQTANGMNETSDHLECINKTNEDDQSMRSSSEERDLIIIIEHLDDTEPLKRISTDSDHGTSENKKECENVKKDFFEKTFESDGRFTVDRTPACIVRTHEKPAASKSNPLSAEFKCYECNKTFSKRCYLTQHNNARHSRAKPFKCKRCGKRFSEPASLNEHFAKHADNKPYKCSQCPKSFNHKTDLRRHMYQHSETKPYTCNTCGVGFAREDHMLKHSSVHFK